MHKTISTTPRRRPSPSSTPPRSRKKRVVVAWCKCLRSSFPGACSCGANKLGAAIPDGSLEGDTPPSSPRSGRKNPRVVNLPSHIPKRALLHEIRSAPHPPATEPTPTPAHSAGTQPSAHSLLLLVGATPPPRPSSISTHTKSPRPRSSSTHTKSPRPSSSSTRTKSQQGDTPRLPHPRAADAGQFADSVRPLPPIASVDHRRQVWSAAVRARACAALSAKARPASTVLSNGSAREQLRQLVEGVAEANQLVVQLQRDCQFEAICYGGQHAQQIAVATSSSSCDALLPASADGGTMHVGVSMRTAGASNIWFLDHSQFQGKLQVLRQIATIPATTPPGGSKSATRVVDAPPDPCLHTPAYVCLGVSNHFLSGLAHKIEYEGEEDLHRFWLPLGGAGSRSRSHEAPTLLPTPPRMPPRTPQFKRQCTSRPILRLSVLPCDATMTCLGLDEFCDDPVELLGKPLHLKIVVHSARYLPCNRKVKVQFADLATGNTVESHVVQSDEYGAAEWSFEHTVTIQEVDLRFLDFLLEDGDGLVCSVLVWQGDLAPQ